MSADTSKPKRVIARKKILRADLAALLGEAALALAEGRLG